MRVAASSEKYSCTFVEATIMVHKRLLSISSSSELLTNMDEDFGLNNPLNSVYKLQTIIRKCMGQACIVVTVQKLDYLWRTEYLTKDYFLGSPLIWWT